MLIRENENVENWKRKKESSIVNNSNAEVSMYNNEKIISLILVQRVSSKAFPKIIRPNILFLGKNCRKS